MHLTLSTKQLASWWKLVQHYQLKTILKNMSDKFRMAYYKRLKAGTQRARVLLQSLGLWLTRWPANIAMRYPTPGTAHSENSRDGYARLVVPCGIGGRAATKDGWYGGACRILGKSDTCAKSAIRCLPSSLSQSSQWPIWGNGCRRKVSNPSGQTLNRLRRLRPDNALQPIPSRSAGYSLQSLVVRPKVKRHEAFTGWQSIRPKTRKAG